MLRFVGPLVVFALAALGPRAVAQPFPIPHAAADKSAEKSIAPTSDDICRALEEDAAENGLPVEFFARVIWQESRFHPDTVGPRRRNGQSAQGIAQFMPSTAAEKGLLDPFDPVQALPKAAQFLRELKDQFGNLGLAAAAYNAGPSRVRGWLAGARMLSVETRNYVAAVTGIPAEEWAKTNAHKPAAKTSPNCAELMALVQQPVPPQRPPMSSHGEPAQSHNARLAENERIGAPLGPSRGDLATPRHKAPSLRGDMGEQPASPQGSGVSSNGERLNAQIAKNGAIAAPFDPMREGLVTPHEEAPSSRSDIAKQPGSPQGPQMSSHGEPAQSHNVQLAEHGRIGAPLGPSRGDLATPRDKAPSLRGDMGKQPASPQGSGLSSNGERPKLHNAQIAKNGPIAAPFDPMREGLVTPQQEAPSSRGDIAKQPASPQAPPMSSHGEPAQSHAQLAKNDPVARGDLVTPHQETPYSRGDMMNPFIEKLTERVKLTADSPWGIQLSAGFSRESVLTAYATIASRYAEILAGKDASILSSVFRSRGTRAFYQIRVGTDTLESANDLCASIRRAGGACMVLRNAS
jgi:Transglycosylase SLT domain/SPOR domain